MTGTAADHILRRPHAWGDAGSADPADRGHGRGSRCDYRLNAA